MEAALRAQAAEPRPQSREGYLAHWSAWAQHATGADENRGEAVQRMIEWLDAGVPSEQLDLSVLGLTSLPQHLPAGFDRLDISGNQLTRLPDNLPAGLTNLDISLNQLTHLPDNFPPSLTVLYVSHNRLISLPENLPASLLELDVRHNQLTSLPENIATRFGWHCNFYFENNPLPERVRSNLAAAMNVDDYHGPRIYFSMPEGVASHEADISLPKAVARWYGPDDQAAATETWSAFTREPNAGYFSRFLVRLQGTVNASSPQFKQATAQWLTHLADDPGLRQDTFVISQEATTSCEDRVSLSLNAMKSAGLTADVQRGDYDQRLPELLALAKGMFRLDQLEGIAREKVKSLRFVDEIEVYLAYQVKLRGPLALPLDTTDMRFFDVSYVEEDDLTAAKAQVQHAEREHFPDFLASQWQPWQSVLQRLIPQRHEQAFDQLIEALDKPFKERLQKRLQALGLQDNPDAKREIGPQITAEIVREIKLPLTRDFLRERGLESHIQFE